MPNAKAMPIPAEMFAQQAERRVKLGLITAEIVKANGHKQARAGQGRNRRLRQELRGSEGSDALVLR